MKTLTNIYKFQLEGDDFHHFGYLINETDMFLIINDIDSGDTLYLCKDLPNFNCKHFEIIFKDIPLEVVMHQFDGINKEILPFLVLEFISDILQYASGNQNLEMVKSSLSSFYKEVFKHN